MSVKLFIRESTYQMVKHPPKEIFGKLHGVSELFIFEAKQVPDDEKVFMGNVKLVRVRLGLNDVEKFHFNSELNKRNNALHELMEALNEIRALYPKEDIKKIVDEAKHRAQICLTT